MKLRLVVVVGVAALILSSAPARAAEPDPELVHAEKVLKEIGIATDGPGLLDYFRKQTVTAELEKELQAAVRRLGDNDFQTREQASARLAQAGRLALPFLNKAAKDPDLEIAHRASMLLEEIQLTPIGTRMTAACRLLIERRPAGAAAVLLAYLPNAADETVEDAVFHTLGELGLRDGKPDAALTKALADSNPLRRAAAASVVGRCPDKGDRAPAVKLLADPDARVRFEAAGALLRAGDKAALPPLIALLNDAPIALAWQAEELLFRLAGDQPNPPSLGTGTKDERKKCCEAWDKWWKANEGQVDLAKVKTEELLRGLTVTTEYDGEQGGRVWEFGADGKVRWEIKNLNGPNDVQLLPGGRVLIAERNGSVVTERDREGKVLWEYKVQNSAIAAQRLPNGNTLVCTFNELLELSPDKKVVHQLNEGNGLRHAIRIKNGHILYVTAGGNVVELTAEFKPVRTITPEKYASGAGYWASVEPLPNGRLLVALGTSNKVVELDGTGKVLWEVDSPNAVFATRLRNGNTLVSNFEGKVLLEYNRDGKQVGTITLAGRPFVFRRY